MTVYNPENNKPLKHYAFDAKSNARYIVIALENQTDPNTCSVIDLDTLESQMSSELLAYINSDVCQHSYEVWRELDKKMFMDYPKATMLGILRAMHKIKSLPSEQVLIQMPNEEIRNPKEVMKGLREYFSKNGKTTTAFNPEPEPVRVDEVRVVESKDSEVESKNASDIKELKEQMASLTSMMAELVKATKASKKK